MRHTIDGHADEFEVLVLEYLITSNTRIKHMDAVVTTLQGDVATLKTQVAAVLAKLSGVSLPADDAAAIAQANSDLAALNSQIATALTPPVPATPVPPAAP
jgi:hypothetical protein